MSVSLRLPVSRARHDRLMADYTLLAVKLAEAVKALDSHGLLVPAPPRIIDGGKQ
jgi:hypothetical protein